MTQEQCEIDLAYVRQMLESAPMEPFPEFREAATHIPRERISEILNDSGAGVLLTTRQVWDDLGEIGFDGKVVFDEDFTLDEDSVFDGDSVLAGINNSRVGSLAYMIYTSGSACLRG